MKVLVCGGRDFDDGARLREVMNSLHENLGPITVLVHGAAAGADSMAGTWATIRHIEVRAYPADWKKHGRSAGPIRNQQMLDAEKPELVVAFPGGRGTAHMVRIAKEQGFNVVQPVCTNAASLHPQTKEKQ
jgi:hypothetical protein